MAPGITELVCEVCGRAWQEARPPPFLSAVSPTVPDRLPERGGMTLSQTIPTPARSWVRAEKWGPLSCRKNEGPPLLTRSPLGCWCGDGCRQLSFPECAAFFSQIISLNLHSDPTRNAKLCCFSDEAVPVCRALTQCFGKPLGWGELGKFSGHTLVFSLKSSPTMQLLLTSISQHGASGHLCIFNQFQ